MKRKTLITIILFLIGIVTSFSQIPSHLLQGAMNGNATMQWQVAKYYENGQGVKKDTDEAIQWYKKSIAGGCNTASVHLAALYESIGKRGDAYIYFMQYYTDVKESLEGKGKVDRIEPKLLALSQYKIGEYKLYGFDGIEKDVKGSITFFRDAVSNNYGDFAYINLANAYLETGDSAKALSYLVIAEDKYHSDVSKVKLAQCYIKGIGCKKDYDKAYELLESIANKGDNIALLTIGNLLYSRDFGRHNYATAFRWYSKLAESTNKIYKGTALRKLSAMYRYGLGVKEDSSKAETLLREAASYGDEDAKSLFDSKF